MFDVEEEIKPGQRLGRFEIVRPLGKGGMGAVYLANDTLLDVTVAIKVLDPSLATDEGFERFRREVLNARQVAHPGVCRIFDMHEEQGHFFISMEYVEGPTLQQVLVEAGVLPPAIAIAITRAICRAVGAAHQLSIVHRDLKPGNIIVRGRDRVSILDFGLSMAASMGRITEAGVALGTIHYMPPEAIRGENATKQSDIYATGVCLYECVTGRLPFEGSNVLELQSAILEGRMVPASRFVPGISEQLEACISKAMAVEPADRHGSMESFGAALRQADQNDVAGGDPTSARLPSAVDRLLTTRSEPLESDKRTAALGSLPAPLEDDQRTEAVQSYPNLPQVTAPAGVLGDSDRTEAVPALWDPLDMESSTEGNAPAADLRRRRRGNRTALLAASLTVGAAAGLVALFAVFGDGKDSSAAIEHTGGAADAAVAGAPGANPKFPIAIKPASAEPGPPDAATAAIGTPDAAPAPAPEQVAASPRERLVALGAKIRALKNNKGIIRGDSSSFDTHYRRLKQLSKKDAKLAEAEREGKRALATLRRISINQAFVKRKLGRFNKRFDRIDDSTLESKVIAIAQQAMSALDRKDFISANKLLNQGFEKIKNR